MRHEPFPRYWRLVSRFAPHLATVALLAFVGGPALVAPVASVALTAKVLQRNERFRLGIGVVAALIINLLWLYLFVSLVLPSLRGAPMVGGILTDPIHQVGFRPIPYPDASRELSRTGALLILLVPGITSSVVLWFGRRRHHPFSQRTLDGPSWWASLLPMIAFGALKFAHPWRALAFVMSGDGRNHFLIIEEIRVQAGTVTSPLVLSSPKLANALASLLSAGNGAVGTLQSRDLWAMAAIWVSSASILVLVCMAGFRWAAGDRHHNWSVWPALAAAAFLIATNSFLLGTSLLDGFFSLYFGTAVLAAALLLAAALPTDAAKLAILSCCVVVEMGSYTFLAPIIVVLLVIETYRFAVVHEQGARRVQFLIGGSAVLAAGSIFVIHHSWHSFTTTASYSGAITPVQSDILYVLLALTIPIWLLTKAQARSTCMTVSVALGAALATLYLIEHVSANIGPGNSYYGSKTIVGAAGAVLALSLAPLAHLLTPQDRRRSSTIKVSAAVVIAGLLPYGIAQEASPLREPWFEIHDGWVRPDSLAVEQVVGRWGQAPYIFFRFDDNPPEVVYPSVGDDRMMNFWAPTTWGYSGKWVSMWNWVYLQMSSLDPAVLCPAVEAGVQTVYTRDPDLSAQIDDACGPNTVNFVVVPRASQ